jgi:hypothetical protein
MSEGKHSSMSENEEYDEKNDLKVYTYILILEVNWVDVEKKTYNAWVEMGFYYDVHDYLRTFDYFVEGESNENKRKVRLQSIAPEDLCVPFDIVNAIAMEKRSEAHFIRKMDDGVVPKNFYSEKEDDPSQATSSNDYLSDKKGLVKSVDISACTPKKYWKFETRTHNMELSYKSTDYLAPFDSLHFFVKLITADCRPGTNRIKFIYNNEESDYGGMKQTIAGFEPVKNMKGNLEPTINRKHTFQNKGVSWDRLYVSKEYKTKTFQSIFQYYVVPTLLFGFMIIRPFDSADSLLGVASTLIIANIALLIVVRDNFFTFNEQAVLAQIIMLAVGTIILASNFDPNVEDDDSTELILRIALGVADLVTISLVLLYHYVTAERINLEVREAVAKGDFKILETL